MRPLKEDPLRAAKVWKAENQRAFEMIVDWAYKDQSHGITPSIGLYAELLRRGHFLQAMGLQPMDEEFHLRNAIRAILSRLIMELYPDLHFIIKKSMVDGDNPRQPESLKDFLKQRGLE